jgi:hypothetical protein
MRNAAAVLVILALSAGTAAGQTREQGRFVIVSGTDTVAVESFSRTSERLEGSVRGAAVGRVDYVYDLGAEATVREATIRIWPAGSDTTAAPAQATRVVLDGDSVVATVSTPAGDQSRRMGAARGSMPLLNLSFAQMEQVLLRSKQLDGARVEVPLLFMPGAQALPATITWTDAESAVVEIANTELRATWSADGRLLGGGVPAQGLTFTRVDTGRGAAR